MHWSVVVGGVFIAPTTKRTVGGGCCRMAHRTVWCASHVTRPLGSDRWSFWQVGHRTVTVHCPVRLLMPALTSARAVNTVHCSCTVADDRWRLEPLLFLVHWTVRWIIAEWLPEFPKVASLELGSLVHRIVRCARPGLPLGCLLLSLFEPFLGLFIGLLWTFGTCKTYNLEEIS
jgi:hypothetical protein